jgi:hypothetical protein
MDDACEPQDPLFMESSWEDALDFDEEPEVEVDTSDAAVVAQLVDRLGTEAAYQWLLRLSVPDRGVPALRALLDRFRNLRKRRILTEDGYFFVVSCASSRSTRSPSWRRASRARMYDAGSRARAGC